MNTTSKQSPMIKEIGAMNNSQTHAQSLLLAAIWGAIIEPQGL